MTKGVNSDIKELLALRYYASSIQMFNKRKVSSAQLGNRLSVTRGKGMDFEEVRRYQPGDDIRLIHWPLTARLGKPFTKIYKEERERAIYLLIDQSTSMRFGTKVCFKSVLAAKTAALLGFAGLSHHEQIGGVVFNDNVAEYVKPRRSRRPLLDLFNLIINDNTIKHQQGGLNNTLQFISRNIQTGSMVILISDFFKFNEDTKTYLRLITQKCELMNIFIYDPLEASLPASGDYAFTYDGTQKLEINANSQNQGIYQTAFLKRFSSVEELSQKNNIQFIQLATNDDLVQKISHGIIKYGY